MEHKVERNVLFNVTKRDKLTILDFKMDAYLVFCASQVSRFSQIEGKTLHQQKD